MAYSVNVHHPIDAYFKSGTIPSVWCPGCGIGTVVYTFFQAAEEENINHDRIDVVSGFGCTGKIAEYLNLSSYEVPDGFVFRLGAKLSYQYPENKVVVFSNNTDFLISGAQDFIEIRRHSTNLIVIHINNFFYIKTERGVTPATPLIRTSTEEFIELPYNIPFLAKACGASYIARWTPFHAGWLKYAIIDALSRTGLSTIEVINPCLIYNVENHRIGDPVERMKFYNDCCIIGQNESMERLDIRTYDRKIIIGKFLDLG